MLLIHKTKKPTWTVGSVLSLFLPLCRQRQEVERPFGRDWHMHMGIQMVLWQVICIIMAIN